MRALTILAVGATLLARADPARAEVVSDHPQQVRVVIYQDNNGSQRWRFENGQANERPDFDDEDTSGLAMISETRVLDLPAGRQTVRFKDVADGIMPETVVIDGLPDGVIERNYDFNLMSPGALIDAAIGGAVRIVRTNPATGAAEEKLAVLRSGPTGVLLEIDGAYEALGCGAGPEKLVFDRAPEGLSDRPTLSIAVNAPKAGRYAVTLNYLAVGLKWNADYVARVRPDGRTLDLFGWLTLSNAGSSTFGDAPTEVVAGRLSRVSDAPDPPPAPRRVGGGCWPMGTTTDSAGHLAVPAPPPPPASAKMWAPMATSGEGLQEIVVTATRMATASEFGDYKLYTLPGPTTVAARQSKQVAFLDQKAARFETVHVATFDDDFEDDEPSPAALTLRMQNRIVDGLGKPLPGGTVSVMEAGKHGPMLVGQSYIEDTAVGLPVELEVGRSPDIAVTRIVLREWTTGRKERERSEYEVTVTNAGATGAKVELKQPRQDLKIVTQSARSIIKGDAFQWDITVAAGGSTTVRYVVEEIEQVGRD